MRIAIAGAGIGGMTLAALASRAGHEVILLEKASAFGEVGAGIQISPNGSRILSEIGLGPALSQIGTTPERIVLRRWADDSELLIRPLGTGPVERFGHAYYNVYRPDLIDILATAVTDVQARFGAEVVGASQGSGGPALELTDGTTVEADVVVGADGIHSPVRQSLFGDSPSRFSGSVAYRALVPRERVADLPIEVTNRVGPDSHLVSYFVGRRQRYFNLVCIVPEPTWDLEGWNEPGSVDDLRAHFASWAPPVIELLSRVEAPVFRWALHDRPALPQWGRGAITLLGDACHPMLPFMAQGACQSIEDAAVLTRLLSDCDPTGIDAALTRYAALRRTRTDEVQKRSWDNATTYHLPDGEKQRRRDAFYLGLSPEDGADAFDWLYGYDALTADLNPEPI